MQLRTLALIVAAALAAGCVGTETKPEQPAPEKASAAPAPEPVAAAPAKPECPPPPAPSKKKTTKKTAKKEEKPLAPPDCEPAKAKTAAAAPAASASKPATTAAATAAAPATAAATTSAVGKSCNPCVVKSRDGTFDGEVYGNIPAGSKWAKLQIGMEQPEVERLLGVSQNVHAYPTAKAWIPFYYGTDRYRYEVRYPGQGSVSYTGGSWGAGQGVLMMINYDPSL